MTDGDRSFILRSVVLTLSAVIVMLVACMLYGLFDVRVDDSQILSIVGQSFTTIIGAFVGLLGGFVMTRSTPQVPPPVMSSHPPVTNKGTPE